MKEERELIKEFATKMLNKIKLRHNRYAPLGWKTMDTKRLVTLLKGELEEFEEALKEGDNKHAADEAIDIANYAFFLSVVVSENNEN